jgi:hypothetical protein
LLAKRDFIPLETGIDLLTTYLNMIRIQVREFNFKIASSVEAPAIEIPNGLILAFLEELVEKEFQSKNGPKQLHISFSLSENLVCTMAHNIIGNTRVSENYTEPFSAFSDSLRQTDQKLNGILNYKVETEQLENQIVSAKLLLKIPYLSKK